MHRLKSLSEVAYVRFASVYRQFQGIKDFAEALNHFSIGNDHPQKLEIVAQEDSVCSCEDSSIDGSASLCSASLLGS